MNIIKKIFVGFNYGIGMFIAIYSLIFFARMVDDRIRHPHIKKDSDVYSDIVISNENVINKRVFIGFLTNNSEYILDKYSIRVLLYGDSNEIIGSCQDTMYEDLAPGKKRVISIKCEVDFNKEWRLIESRVEGIEVTSPGLSKNLV